MLVQILSESKTEAFAGQILDIPNSSTIPPARPCRVGIGRSLSVPFRLIANPDHRCNGAIPIAALPTDPVRCR